MCKLINFLTILSLIFCRHFSESIHSTLLFSEIRSICNDKQKYEPRYDIIFKYKNK